MLLAMLESFISFLYIIFQLVIFCALWTAYIVGVFIVVRLLLSARINSTVCDFIAFAFASSLMFQLVKLYGKSSAIRKMVLDAGPPVHCMGLSWFTGVMSPHSCSEYYEALQSSIFWELNVLHVSGSLFSDVMISIASTFGGALGGFLQSFLSKIDWLLRIPVFIITSLCLLSSIFSFFGYRFDLFYGLIRINFAQQQVTRFACTSTPRIHSEKSPGRKFVECKREDTEAVLLINELYQKTIRRS